MVLIAPARTDVRRPARLVLGVLTVVVVAAVATLGHRSHSSSDPFGTMVHGEHRGALGADDGVVPDGTTVLDDDLPAVAELDPALRAALREATGDAADDGVQLYVTSGWRSAAYQRQLRREAVAAYGSEAAAAQWVATPETSAHVAGDAVDVGHTPATTWLSAHGAGYGLCQVYDNEPWHFELRPDAVEHGCPPTYADPTQDPRTQQ